jgi:hypothetical protein
MIAFNFPAEAQAWAHQQGYTLLSDYAQTSHTGSEGQGELVLLSPPPNTTYRIDPNFDLSSQQVQIEVAAGQGISQVTIWMDGNVLASLSSPPYQTWWALAPGEHHVWAQGLKANEGIVKSDMITITVIGK